MKYVYICNLLVYNLEKKIVGEQEMNLFISWSGELSNQVAQILSRKIPCIIQAVVPFVSTTDIEKGENWNTRVSSELSETKFGIVCLTQENVSAPWVNYEAGAISKTLDSRVSALLIGIQPSDIQGPLKTFQATKLEKSDFLLLLRSINSSLDSPVRPELLNDSFEMVWPSIDTEIGQAIKNAKVEPKKLTQKIENVNNATLEEILSLVRMQNNILNKPEALLPLSYLEKTISMINRERTELYNNNRPSGQIRIIMEIIDWLEEAYKSIKDMPYPGSILRTINLNSLTIIIMRFIKMERYNGTAREDYSEIHNRLRKLEDEIQFGRLYSDDIKANIS